MPKQDADEVKKEIKKQKEDFYGDESVSSGSPDPESDDDVEDMVEEVVGHEPEQGDSMAHEVEEAEDARRGDKPHEGEEEDEPELQ